MLVLGGGPRNMNSMRPPLAAIFFMTNFYRNRGGPCPPRPPLDPLLWCWCFVSMLQFKSMKSFQASTWALTMMYGMNRPLHLLNQERTENQLLFTFYASWIRYSVNGKSNISRLHYTRRIKCEGSKLSLIHAPRTWSNLLNSLQT